MSSSFSEGNPKEGRQVMLEIILKTIAIIVDIILLIIEIIKNLHK